MDNRKSGFARTLILASSAVTLQKEYSESMRNMRAAVKETDREFWRKKAASVMAVSLNLGFKVKDI